MSLLQTQLNELVIMFQAGLIISLNGLLTPSLTL